MGKGEISLRAISPFPTVFSKGLFPRASKGLIVWEWVNLCVLTPVKTKLFFQKTLTFLTCIRGERPNFTVKKVSLQTGYQMRNLQDASQIAYQLSYPAGWKTNALSSKTVCLDTQI